MLEAKDEAKDRPRMRPRPAEEPDTEPVDPNPGHSKVKKEPPTPEQMAYRRDWMKMSRSLRGTLPAMGLTILLMCMYIYIYIYMCVCVQACMYTCLYMYMILMIHMCVSLYNYKYALTFLCLLNNISSIYAYVHVYLRVCAFPRPKTW